MNLIIKRIILVSIFVLPFIFLSSSYYPAVFPKSLFIEAITLILGTLWIIGRLFKKEENTIPKNIVFLTFFAFIFFLLISFFNSVVPSLSFWGSIDHSTGVIFTLCLFLFSLIVSSVFKTMEDWHKLFTVFIASGILFAFGTFLSEMGVRFFSHKLTIDFTIGNSSYAGIYLVFIFFISLGIIFSSKIKSQRIIGILGLITAFLNPILTGFIAQTPGTSFGFIGLAKTASYSLLVGIGLFALYLFFRKISSIKWRKIFIGSFISILLAGVLYVSFIGFGSIRQWVSEKAGPNRFVFWDIALKGFKEKPILGWGNDTYHLVYTKYFNPIITTSGYAPEYWVDRSHSIYFDELVSGGILGFFFLMSLYGILLFGLIQKAVKDRGKEGILYMALFAGVVSFLIQGVMFFQTVIGWFIISLLIAFVANFCFRNRIFTFKTKIDFSKYKVIISIFLIILFSFGMVYFIFKPYGISHKLASFPRMEPNERLIIYDKINNAYMGNTADLGTAFLPFGESMRKVLFNIKLSEEDKKGAINEMNKITDVLENGLKKENYMDMKLLMSTVEFYSILTSLAEGQDKINYYNKGISYIDKMLLVSPKNHINEMSKGIMDFSLKQNLANLPR
ncbi:MAG: O-antigen ligase family protein [Candidatus Paceibacterota bacterium]